MSSSERYVLDTCTIEDIPQLAEVRDAAFLDFRLHQLTAPESQVSPEAWRSWYHGRMREWFKQPELKMFKITDTTSGRIVAWARWSFPHAKMSEEEASKRSHELGTPPQGVNMALFAAIDEILDTWRARYVSVEDTYVAHFLATHPDHQRQGLASRLLRAGLDQADAEGRDAYIEASPAGYPVYIKAGFKEVNRVAIQLEQYGGDPGEEEISVCMIRKPVSKVIG